MNLLVIDNYDSFTYNLVQYFGQLNATVEVFRNDAISIEELQVDQFDGIVIARHQADIRCLPWASMCCTGIWGENRKG